MDSDTARRQIAEYLAACRGMDSWQVRDTGVYSAMVADGYEIVPYVMQYLAYYMEHNDSQLSMIPSMTPIHTLLEAILGDVVAPDMSIDGFPFYTSDSLAFNWLGWWNNTRRNINVDQSDSDRC